MGQRPNFRLPSSASSYSCETKSVARRASPNRRLERLIVDSRDAHILIGYIDWMYHSLVNAKNCSRHQPPFSLDDFLFSMSICDMLQPSIWSYELFMSATVSCLAEDIANTVTPNHSGRRLIAYHIITVQAALREGDYYMKDVPPPITRPLSSEQANLIRLPTEPFVYEFE